MTKQEPPERGLFCPRCHSRWVPVQRTVKQPHGGTLRYRKCQHCGRRFATYERMGAAPKR